MSKSRKVIIWVAVVLALLLAAGVYFLTGEVRVLGPIGRIDLERSLYRYDRETGEVGELSGLRLSGWFWTWKHQTDKNECHLDPLEVEALPDFAPDTSLGQVEGDIVMLNLHRFVFADTENAFAELDGHDESLFIDYDRGTNLVRVAVIIDEDAWYLVEAPSPEAVPEAYEDFQARYHDAW